jgi:hypothetical protein
LTVALTTNSQRHNGNYSKTESMINCFTHGGNLITPATTPKKEVEEWRSHTHMKLAPLPSHP